MCKKIKTIGFIACIVVLLAFAGWAFFSTAGSDNYNYQGYVLDITKANNDTVITTITGDTQSEFTVKWYTKKLYNGEKSAIEIGDHIKLSTFGNSANMKKFSVCTGYIMEGKVVYVEEIDAPFILSFSKSTNSLQLYKLIPSIGEIKEMKTGCEIAVRYQYPLAEGNKTVVVDIVEQKSDIPTTLTEQEVTFISAHGLTVSN